MSGVINLIEKANDAGFCVELYQYERGRWEASLRPFGGRRAGMADNLAFGDTAAEALEAVVERIDQSARSLLE